MLPAQEEEGGVQHLSLQINIYLMQNALVGVCLFQPGNYEKQFCHKYQVLGAKCIKDSQVPNIINRMTVSIVKTCFTTECSRTSPKSQNLLGFKFQVPTIEIKS